MNTAPYSSWHSILLVSPRLEDAHGTGTFVLTLDYGEMVLLIYRALIEVIVA